MKNKSVSEALAGVLVEAVDVHAGKKKAHGKKGVVREGPESLLGMWFHSKDKSEPDTIGWQGQIIATPQPGFYLVQLYSWLDGVETDRRLVSFEEMSDWNFYPNNRAMNHAWEKHARAMDIKARRAEYEATRARVEGDE